MSIVYVLYSESTDKRYVGYTQNLEARLNLHNAGKVRATKGGRPWKLIYSENYPSRRAAMQRERSLKSGQGRAELGRILENKGSAP